MKISDDSKPMLGRAKMNVGAIPSIATHESMFHHVSELLQWADTESPFSIHPDLYSVWKLSSETMLDEALDSAELDLTEKEEESFEVAKTIGYSLLEKFGQRARAVGWASQPASLRKAAVEQILSLPQIPQRTPEWYAQGKQVLTASEFATLFKTPRAVSQLVLSKAGAGAPAPTAAPAPTNRLACLTCEMGPFDWGIRFEPVVKQVLEKEGITIAEAGRLLHPKDSHLAASPDGLILDSTTAPRRVGRLIEIKCPISRKIGEGIPFEYWCQMQIQMEVTGIEECEYVEVKIQSIQKEATELAGGHAPEGFVWLMQNPGTAEMVYAYDEEKRAHFEECGWDLLETIPWRIEKMVRDVVVRDRAWFEGTRAVREKFWADVAAAKAGTFQAVEASGRGGRGAAAAAKKEGKGSLQVFVTKQGSAETSPLAKVSPPCLFLDEDDAQLQPLPTPTFHVPAPYQEEDVCAPPSDDVPS